MNYLSTILLLFSIAVAPLTATDHFTIIKSPTPNMTETCFKELVKVGEISEDLGQNEYIFLPFSITADREGNLYIFDSSQARIFKLDTSHRLVKAFGRVGQGPGEFPLEGKIAAAYLNFGLDGNLYANQVNSMLVLVFDKDGKYLKKFTLGTQYPANFHVPAADSRGNLIFQEYRTGALQVLNSADEVLFTLPHEREKKEILFRVWKDPSPSWFKAPFEYSSFELKIYNPDEDRLWLFYPNSATLCRLQKGKEPKQVRIWPKQAIAFGVAEARDRKGKSENGYHILFRDIIFDGDDRAFYYPVFGTNKGKMQYWIYKMNDRDQLEEVLYIPLKEKQYPRILLKKNGAFFSIEDDKIILYKESV